MRVVVEYFFIILFLLFLIALYEVYTIWKDNQEERRYEKKFRETYNPDWTEAFEVRASQSDPHPKFKITTDKARKLH